MKNLLLLLSLLLGWGTLSAQQTPKTYPASRLPESEIARRLDQLFPELNVGFLHVYALAEDEVHDNYLLRGESFPSDLEAALPGRYRRMARKGDAYAAAAIAGPGENLYILRFETERWGNRVELFNREGKKLKHLSSLAYYDCNARNCQQLDSYLSDFDGDGTTDVARVARVVDLQGETLEEASEFYVMSRDGKLLRQDELGDTFENSFEFYEYSRR